VLLVLLVLLAALPVVGTASAGTPSHALAVTWGGAVGSNPGRFEQVYGIIIDGDGSVDVTDSWDHRIQKYDETMWSVIGLPGAPYGIAMDSAGNLLAVDSVSRYVLRYDGFSWSMDACPSNEPRGIAADRNDRLYVVDNLAGTVYRRDGGCKHR
jgi:DNA-binding beta-propeller fold protein YncE